MKKHPGSIVEVQQECGYSRDDQTLILWTPPEITREDKNRVSP